MRTTVVVTRCTHCLIDSSCARRNHQSCKYVTNAMKLIWLILLAGVLFLFLPRVFSASTEPSAEADTAQTLETIRKKYHFPGLAVIVVKDGKICDRAAVGVRKLDDPTLITTNDIFHIGS